MSEKVEHKFNLVRVIKAHMLPITNVAFNKMSTMFCTGSYDRTCKVFDTNSGREIHSLEGNYYSNRTACRTSKAKKLTDFKLLRDKKLRPSKCRLHSMFQQSKWKYDRNW